MPDLSQLRDNVWFEMDKVSSDNAGWVGFWVEKFLGQNQVVQYRSDLDIIFVRDLKFFGG